MKMLCFILLSAAGLLVSAATARPAGPISQTHDDMHAAMRLPKGVQELDQAIDRFIERKYDQCAALLAEACKKQPDLLPARFMLAQLYLLNDQLVEGRTTLEQATIENPDHPENYTLWGIWALQDNRTADAAVHFEKALALAKSGNWSEKHRRFFLIDCASGLATVAERRGNWNAAKAALSDWLEQEPKLAVIRQRLANALFQLNQPDQAYAELQQAQKDNASLEPPAVTMARLWAGKKDSTKADQWMETALKQAPDDPKTLQPYAAWLLDRNRAEEAKAPADKAAQSGSVSDDLKFLRGLIAWHLKHYEEAERDFQALYTESPGNFTASNRLVLALNEQSDLGKRRRALQLAEMNARLYPKSSDALASLGWVYFYQGKLEQAEQYLHAALADGTANPEIAYFLARVIAERGGRDAEAKHYFKTVLDTPGRNAFRKESEEALARLSSAR